ncbi:hypothetical protein Vadar_016089 [Vaccinium darrowii]|uniref:Uncharacterized protein n=1 Tax=Vaccinium darrowii TaxID=229202 RepID=A0ACB7XR74_9ERIC|nr:hypothetical protein Vadar_016089 [Vaccinium darrowii]
MGLLQKLPCLVSLVLFAVLSYSADTAFASVEEVNALLKWKETLWSANRSVTQLKLTNSGLNCTLETFSFSLFPNLAYVDLNTNELSSPIPPQISSLPLVYLDLSANEFSGTIPPEIGHLKNLKTLHLEESQFHSSIPPEMGQMTSLSELALHTNSLSGPIPSSLGNLSNLVSIYLYDNQLSGSIPEEIETTPILGSFAWKTTDSLAPFYLLLET